MTATAKVRPTPRPLKLLAALMQAQQELLEVPASTSTRRVDGRVEETTTYAGSEDTLRAARAALHRHGLMATPHHTTMRIAEHSKAVMTIGVHLLHLDSGQELLRTFDVEVSSQYGSNAAATSGYATALRLLLGLPRAPESTVVSALPQPESAEEILGEPRATHRVVIPAPTLAERIDMLAAIAESAHGATVDGALREAIAAMLTGGSAPMTDERRELLQKLAGVDR